VPGLILVSSGRVIAESVVWARTPVERMRGLLGSSPQASEALIIAGARQVHTFGMRYPIDVLFVDLDWTVCRVVVAMAPRRVTTWVPRARYALELAAGPIGDQAILGERLAVVDLPIARARDRPSRSR